MKKAIVLTALLFLIIGIFSAFSIQETRVEEVVVDEWDPITPSILYPQNVTGWAFMALTPNGTFLELNISASDIVRIIIEKLISYNETTGKKSGITLSLIKPEQLSPKKLKLPEKT